MAAEEPTLPRLPAVSWDADTQTFGNSRKRVRIEDASALFSNSSDPAMFSSDDDPALDNYVQGRRKKRYVGAWFAQHPASGDSTFEEEPRLPTAKPKRTLERQLDSGVWMGGDGTDGEEGKTAMPPPLSSQLPVVRRERSGFHRVSSLRVSSAEKEARHHIQKCIDEGCESIDLNLQALESLSNGTIEPLSGFSCVPLVTEDVPFTPKDPSIKLFLNGNLLTRLPGAIFHVEHITLLSVRGNRLTEIPPAISKLRNLESLNVAMNDLKYLPFELLDLITEDSRLRDLRVHPNPFYHETNTMAADAMPFLDEAPQLDAKTYQPLSVSLGALRKGLYLRSPAQFLDSNGRLCAEARIPAWGSDRKLEFTPEFLSTLFESSRVPTLLELALLSCSQSPELGELASLLPDDSPPRLTENLALAVAQKESGGMACSVCGRPVVAPRSQWLEWWELRKQDKSEIGELLSSLPDERFVPFIRRGCSWKCAPKPTTGDRDGTVEL